MGIASCMMDGIEGILAAFLYRLIGNINSIFAPVPDNRLPFGNAFRSLCLGFCLTESSIEEGILEVAIYLLLVCKASPVACFPSLLTNGLGITGSLIIINNIFLPVDIPFTRQQHIGSCILQHRNQEGEHVALGIKVLDGLHEATTLPLPAVQFLLVVPAVTLPEGYVPVLHACL